MAPTTGKPSTSLAQIDFASSSSDKLETLSRQYTIQTGRIDRSRRPVSLPGPSRQFVNYANRVCAKWSFESRYRTSAPPRHPRFRLIPPFTLK